MALRTCDPTSGSIGKQTYAVNRGRQVVRVRAIPSNPKTPAQLNARANLTTASKAWDALTDEQRAAWREAAKAVMSKSRLGQKATLTGNQYYVQVNAAIAEMGGAAVTDPPATPSFSGTNCSELVITNAAGTITLKVSTTDQPPDDTELWGAPPVKPGVNRAPGMVYLGTLDSPANSAVDISTAYKARFGSPAVGSRVFVEVREMELGIKGETLQFQAVVPASS
jgi:hypothetical protein